MKLLLIMLLVFVCWPGIVRAQTTEQRLAVLQHDNDLLRKDVEIANLKRSDAEKDLARAQADVTHYRGLYLGEQSRQMMTGKPQLVPHKAGVGFTGTIFKVIDSWEFQSFAKWGFQFAGSAKAFTLTQRCIP